MKLKWNIILDSEIGEKLITQDDEFLSNLNQKTINWLGCSSLDHYIWRLSKCIEKPDQEEIEELNKISQDISEKWELFKFPELRLNFCFTNGRDANGLPYTRGDTIFYPRNRRLDQVIVVHEIFHILSRKNPNIKEILYKHFGFEQTDIRIPENIYLVNPDSPKNNYKIKLKKFFFFQVECIPFFNVKKGILYFSLFDINKQKTQNIFLTNLFWKIGITTQYVAHPEEICADYFKFLFYPSFFTNKGKIEVFKEKLLSCF